MRQHAKKHLTLTHASDYLVVIEMENNETLHSFRLEKYISDIILILCVK